ncbi:cytochrome c5 family protein [Shewanella avicenniae]|uniref:Cytochrome c5 family protein n=1 Tax=Shewanella avicenniae TaxID=2814294 RepID=A0ABX7QR61_9GAMM|nr:c-type cytochrome [Shewanella avicenniae]QSX33947.1 cytochrome c5 family protein [Shewanella avicenniae]
MKKMCVIAVVAASLFSLSSYAADGQAVYNKSCMFCHASGVGGAPRAHDEAAWKSLMDKGMPALLKSVKEGKGNMPANAMCSSCSEDDFKASIDFMAKKKS